MCGRFGLYLDDGFQEYFSLEGEQVEVRNLYNIAPGYDAAVITRNSPNKLEFMNWGLLPPWEKVFNNRYKRINARAETVATMPSYRHAFNSQRCIVPISFFYEWARQGKTKIPYLFHDTKNKWLGLAGLYEVATDAGGKEWHTFTIITTKANKVVSAIHDRMPVILTQKQMDTWLDKEASHEDLLKMLDSYESKTFEKYEVTQEVNSAEHNEPSLIKPVHSPKQSSLI
jgi:putative SOS response-associated peptidase YedK